MALDNVEYEPYYIFAEGALDENTDPDAITYSSATPATDYDWSGVAVRRDHVTPSFGNDMRGAGALISPLHFLLAEHNGAYNIDYHFLAPDGTHETRYATLAGNIEPGPDYNDIRILKLDSELPSKFEVYKVVTNVDRLLGYSFIIVEPNREVILRRILGTHTFSYGHADYTRVHEASWQQVAPTGSGNPVFVAYNGELLLAGTNWANFIFPLVEKRIDEIDALLDADGAYALQTVEAPVVPTPQTYADTPFPLNYRATKTRL